MVWFSELTGFRESLGMVRSNMLIEGTEMRSKVNGSVHAIGDLELLSLGELRERLRECEGSCMRVRGRLELREYVGDIQLLHADKVSAGSIFQVASQFNLLEMSSPDRTPADGVDCYEDDRTQGPSCAIACGYGTIYRNYFATTHGSIGQLDSQIDCLLPIGEILGNGSGEIWEMRNGYALISSYGSILLGDKLRSLDELGFDMLREALRVGVHSGVGVTIGSGGHTVSQVYCSALPLTYMSYAVSDSVGCRLFARLILESSYESMILSGILNYAATGNPNVYLTLLGGGVFGNDIVCIMGAIERSVMKYRGYGLRVHIVSYGSSNALVREFVSRIADMH